MGILSMFRRGNKDSGIPQPETDNLGSAGNLGLSDNSSGIGRELGMPTGLETKDMNAQMGSYENTPPLDAGISPESLNKNADPQMTSANTFNAQTNNPNDLFTLGKNIEVLSSKLDAIRAILDNLSNKVEKIEKIAEGEHEESGQQNAY